MKTTYVTTTIPYVNAPPHMGHAYEFIIADVIARWHRLCGDDVRFLTGTDDNAQKNEQAAEKAGLPTKEFVDKHAKIFRQLCLTLKISNDDFIQTTEERHVTRAQAIFNTLYDKGDIYKGLYKGMYCVGCEAYYIERDLVDGKCPEHKVAPKLLEQEGYFFKMSKYEKNILKLLKKKGFVVPESKRKDMLCRVEQEGLKDLCVTRSNAEWGIKVPFDEDFRIYVWYEALWNYMTALEYPKGSLFKKYWNGKVIFNLGKGVNWFHSVIFPSVLVSLGIKQPDTIAVHGYVTVNGEKVSKSLGNSLTPDVFVEKYGLDAVRYFLLRQIPFGEDGDFNESALKDRLNNELADDLGNLLSRSLAMVQKYYDGIIPKGKVDKNLMNMLKLDKFEKAMEKYELHMALGELWSFIHEVNKYINKNEPWNNEKTRADVLYTVLDALRIIGILISSFLPDTAEKINKQLGISNEKLSYVKFGLLKFGRKIKKGENIFVKVE